MKKLFLSILAASMFSSVLAQDYSTLSNEQLEIYKEMLKKEMVYYINKKQAVPVELTNKIQHLMLELLSRGLDFRFFSNK